MNISITFRHMASSEALKGYASEKLGKLQKFLRQPMTAKVTFSIDRLKQIAEAQISSGGEHLEAKESSDDVYASLDRVLSKLERQIRAAHGAAQAKRRGSETVRKETESPVVAVKLAGAKKKLDVKPAKAKKTTRAKTSARKKAS